MVPSEWKRSKPDDVNLEEYGRCKYTSYSKSRKTSFNDVCPRIIMTQDDPFLFVGSFPLNTLVDTTRLNQVSVPNSSLARKK